MPQTLKLPRYSLLVGMGIGFVFNFLAFRLFSDTTTGSAYSYVSPDDKTFAVWGLIYSFHFLLTVNHCREFSDGKERQSKDEKYYLARAPLFFQFVTNGLWLFVNGAAIDGVLSYWLAVVVLALNAFCLYQSYHILNIDYFEASSYSSVLRKLSYYVPVSLNLSWVILATFLNFSNTFYSTYDLANKENSVTIVGGADWAIAVVGFACVYSCYLIFTRFDLPFAFVQIWALCGIIRNQSSHSKHFEEADRSTNLIKFCYISMLFQVLVVVLSSLYYIVSTRFTKTNNNGVKEDSEVSLLQ